MIGDAIKSIFGGEDIQSTNVAVDPRTESQLNRLTQEAARSSQDLASEANQGLDDSAKAIVAADKSYLKRLGENDGAVSKAIQKRYENLLGSDIKRLRAQGEVQARLDRGKNLEQAAAVAQARNNINMQNWQRQMQAHQANQAARSQAIASVFGLAGTVGGALIAGPAGRA